ncbi:hypothetical protein LSH36_86g02056 [Paralvinella palmiformis]|uniref:Uncharacterized protein n=1 Tax=Paralvinella palmiformis TaxID=53620 RepID=A0AAD9NCD9_9ANNE|nr:hypothetical protein LSH36_86g02056 [Paralvinella palmiformis]
MRDTKTPPYLTLPNCILLVCFHQSPPIWRLHQTETPFLHSLIGEIVSRLLNLRDLEKLPSSGCVEEETIFLLLCRSSEPGAQCWLLSHQMAPLYTIRKNVGTLVSDRCFGILLGGSVLIAVLSDGEVVFVSRAVGVFYCPQYVMSNDVICPCITSVIFDDLKSVQRSYAVQNNGANCIRSSRSSVKALLLVPGVPYGESSAIEHSTYRMLLCTRG